MTKPAPDVGETPRTNAATFRTSPTRFDRDVVEAVFAQQLERELSQARAALGPVTDEEWGSLKSSGIWGHTRDLIDAMLAKRRKGAGTWLTK